MLFLVGLAVLFLAEIYVVALVVSEFGPMVALLALVLFSAGGAWLLKREGMHTWRTIHESLRDGRVPTSGLVDGFLLMAAGALLFVPGFITDLLGLFLLIPPLRRRTGTVVTSSMQRRVSRRVRIVGSRLGASGTIFDAASSAYRRPDDPSRRGPWSNGGTVDHGDVIDLDAEEFFVGDAVGELEPPDGDR